MEKLKLPREGTELVQGHTANEGPCCWLGWSCLVIPHLSGGRIGPQVGKHASEVWGQPGLCKPPGGPELSRSRSAALGEGLGAASHGCVAMGAVGGGAWGGRYTMSEARPPTPA